MPFVRFAILLLSLLLFSLSAHANPFIGTWELVAGEVVNEQGELQTYSALKMKAIKVIAEHHYSFISMSGDTFWGAGSGRYEFDQTHYVEMPLYTSYPLAPNSEYRFLYQIKNNEWHNERWQGDQRVEFEIWRKLP